MKTKLTKVLGLLLAIAMIATQLMVPAFAVEEKDCTCKPGRENLVEIGRTEATCTSLGVIVYECTVCNGQKAKAIPVLDHDIQIGAAQESKCGNVYWDAYEYCADCDWTTKEPKQSPEHIVDLIPVDAKDATCGKNGEAGHEAYEYCPECGYTTFVEIDKPACVAGDPKEENVVPATCWEDGKKDIVTYCVNCGDELSREKDVVIPTREGHNYGDGYIKRIEPTCTEDGKEIYSCVDCGESIEKTLPATGHDWVEESRANANDPCKEYGTIFFSCKNCGERKLELIEPACTPKVLPAVEATCTEDGLTEGSECSECGKILKPQRVVKALGHDAVFTKYHKDANCCYDGYTAEIKCSRCDIVMQKSEVINKTGLHNEATIVGYDATCTETGLTDGKICLTTLEILEEQKEIPAKGHTEAAAVEENRVEPDCLNTGSYDTVVYCSVCDVELSRVTTTIPANGHKSRPTEGIYEATCEKAGYQIYVCDVCGDFIEVELADKPALGHDKTTAKENEVPATCAAAGSYEEVVYCSRCGELSRETIPVPALPHTEETVIENEVGNSCTEDGSYDSVVYCTVCEAELSRETITVPAKGHKRVENVPAIKATCTTPGQTAGKFCNDCGEYIVPVFGIAAYGHKEVEIPAVAATENNVGYTAGMKCTVCNEVTVEPQAIDESFYFSYEATGINGEEVAVNSGFITLKVFLNVESDFLRLWGADVKIKFNENLTVISGCNEETDKLFDLIKATDVDTANANKFITINQSNMNYPDPELIKDTVFKKTAEGEGYLFATITFKVDKDFYGETIDFEVVVDDCDIARVEEENGVAYSFVDDYENPVGTSIDIMMLGDANGDGKLSVNDSLALTQWVATGEAYNPIFDLDKDGYITGDDFALMRGAIVQDYTYLDK